MILSKSEYLEELSRNVRHSCIKVRNEKVKEAENLLNYIEEFVDSKIN